MSNPDETITLKEYCEILVNEEEEDQDSDGIVEDVELVDDENLISVLENMHLHSGSAVYVEQDDGSLAPVKIPQADIKQMESDSDDDEMEHARMAVIRATSAISPSRDAGDGSRECGRGYVTGRRGRGRRGRGRGRGGRVSGGERQGRAWTRSDPLVQCFASDEEVPEQLREEIMRVMAERSARSDRRSGARCAVNLVFEDDVSDAENECFDDEFVWASMDEWNGVKETFLRETSGPTRVFKSAYDAFRSYWDDSLLSHIVDASNLYAQGIQSESFQRDWFATNVDEILVLFAFWIMLGIIKMPTIKSCFSNHSILRTEIFQSMFSEERYWHLNRAFHLANGSRDANDPDNVLHSMGPVIDELNIKFKQNYTLHQDIFIDESLTLWKGPAKFKQFIQTKSARYDIKTFQLCESSTGYLWSFFVYIGRKTTNSTLLSSQSAVVRLMEPLLNLGHVLYMDNWFNSPMLARYLKSRKTDCVGTLRSSRNYVPAIIQRTPLAEGEFIARQCGDVMIVALQDYKRVSCISTYHDVTQVRKPAKPGRPSRYILQLIDDYNRSMGGVDRLDQMLEPYLLERKQCGKWSKKLFKQLLNIAVQNAKILVEKSTNKKMCAFSFRLALVQSIIDRHRQKVACRIRPGCPSPNPQRPSRLTERHFIRRIPITAEMRAAVRHKNNLGMNQCFWCSTIGRRFKKTAYECPQCKVPLCLQGCFELFHTIE